MTDVTLSPACTWRATVPPQPRTSSSGWAAMTRTRFLSSAILPAPSRPILVAELAARQHAPIVALQLQQCDGTLAAPHRLPAGFLNWAHDRPDDLSWWPINPAAFGRKGAGPDPPALSPQPAKGTGIGAGQCPYEVVDATTACRPIQPAVGRPASRQDGLVRSRLSSCRPLAIEQLRQQPQNHGPIRLGHVFIDRKAAVVRGDWDSRHVDDVTAVDRVAEPKQRVPCFSLSFDEGPIHGRSSTVARQERGMSADEAMRDQLPRRQSHKLRPADDEREIEREVG